MSKISKSPDSDKGAMSNETVEAECNICNWKGSSDLCEENDWDELTCPECGEPVKVHE
jgi:hypothetical protein